MRYILFSIATALLAMAGNAFASDAPEWEEFTFMRYNAIDFSYQAGHVAIDSDGASSMLYRPLSATEKSAATMSWEWKIDESSVPQTMLSASPGDDRMMALYVYFTNAPSSSGSISRDGKYIAYVWGSKHPVGSVIDSEDKKGKFIIVKKHHYTPGQWAAERCNHVKDFEESFGFSAHPSVIAIIADTDDTQAKTLASIRNIIFE